MTELKAVSEQMEKMNYVDFTECISMVRVASEAVYHLNDGNKDKSKDFNVDCYVALKCACDRLDNLVALYEGVAMSLSRLAEEKESKVKK